MRHLFFRPSFSQLKSQAKRLRQEHRAGFPESAQRIRTRRPKFARMSVAELGDIELTLRDAQLVIAREYGFENWADPKNKVEVEMDKRTQEELVAERMKKQTSTDQEIKWFVSEASGSSILSKERITRGYSSEVWRVKTADGQELMYRAN